MVPEHTTEILDKIYDERVRQTIKWGIQDHDDTLWSVILGEEFGEVCRAVYEMDDKEVEEELVQVAAVAVAWLESLDRRSSNE